MSRFSKMGLPPGRLRNVEAAVAQPIDDQFDVFVVEPLAVFVPRRSRKIGTQFQQFLYCLPRFLASPKLPKRRRLNCGEMQGVGQIPARDSLQRPCRSDE